MMENSIYAFRFRVLFRTLSLASSLPASPDLFLYFSPNSPVKVLDINKGYTGDVSKRFIDYSSELNREFVAKGLDSLVGDVKESRLQEAGFLGNGVTKDILIDRLAAYPESWDAAKKQ